MAPLRKWNEKYNKDVKISDDLSGNHDLDKKIAADLLEKMKLGIDYALKELKNKNDVNGNSLECIAERIENFLNKPNPPLLVRYLSTNDYVQAHASLDIKNNPASTKKFYQEPTNWFDKLCRFIFEERDLFKPDPVISINSDLFNTLNDCGKVTTLVHEMIHAACMDSLGKDRYGEKLAYSCVYLIFKDASGGSGCPQSQDGETGAQYGDKECTCKNSENEKKDDSNSTDSFMSAPGGDEPDDNFSFYIGDAAQYLSNSNCLIYMNGYFVQANRLLGGNYFGGIDSAERLLNVAPIIVVPSGGFFGTENDSVFKVILEEYVRQGGTIIVFTNQYGSHIDKVVPIPEGENLHSYGWREDQSCYWGSSYFKGMHPVLAGQNNEKVSAAVDGYFSIYPSNSTVLLRRISNQEPCLLYYPYGQGTVILTSLYTDWGLAHSQATIDELRMVRDLITFARNPKLPIPMFDLKANATPTVDLAAVIKNSTETAAAKMKIRVSTPDRTRVLFETEAALALDGGAETTFPINFTLPALERKDYGICHTDYELYDVDGNIVQLATESDSGRLMV